MAEYHCPICGANCKSLFFDFRDHIIFCDVCRDRIKEVNLEDIHGGQK